MAGIKCPKCNQVSPDRAPLCLECGTPLLLDAPHPFPTSPAHDAGNPWRPTPFPAEIRWVIWVIVLNLAVNVLSAVFAFIERADSSGCFIVVVILLDVVTITGLVSRTGGGWWLSLGLSIVRLGIGLALLTILSMSPGKSTDGLALAFTLIYTALAAVAVILLTRCRARGAYLIRMERDPSVPVRPRKSCSRCGDPCPDVSNTWTRAGFCSKRCMEKNA